MNIEVNLSYLVDNFDLNSYQDKVNKIDKMIREKTGPGNDFLGWVDYPLNYSKKELEEIKKKAQFVRDNFDILLVCGIGGSYLGARAAIEGINGLYKNDKIQIIYFGQTFDPTYTYQVLEYLKNKKFAINVISKSGTTTETSVAFRLAKELLEKQIGKSEASKAIVATTSEDSGALLKLSLKEGYTRFVLPNDIGGRYSVLTPVGLFPIAVSGIDIEKMLLGAQKAYEDFKNPDLTKNNAYKYACVRNHLYLKGKIAEMLITYSPSLVQFGEWWKQLFGESEGKDKKSLLPVSATFTTDLHSLGQYIQDGSNVLFETILHVKKSNYDVKIPHDEENLDNLNYLENKDLYYIQDKAFEGTLLAHYQEAKKNNIIIDVEEINDFNFGYLFYFFMLSCAMSAYLNDVNPFNQPGVEIYKKNMFHLLKKPGF